ncbi:uncharacterized protein J8A68_002335 [[Candida] subhashii]|uniref:Uncharacterized protein n=1 Tax=[Candida] subhashii TaxID=561895 RepID=A0A8J5QJD3_9ASCO|nr:uncharacterized protein J8A68_002335 [[Candida] subhashii]KAG7664152.1 hypothetical protein J8A68_002335 [[Candida] subhashii]
MVLLTDIISSQQCFNNISTGIPSLDQIFIQNISGIKNKIYDFQSASTCNAMYIVIGSLIISHLKNNQPVVIINTLNKFPLHFLTSHPEFESKWVNEKLLVMYTCDTFAKLYSCFLFNHKTNIIHNNSIIIINDFHELIELYKLELSSAHEELILKHHIDMNSTLLLNNTTTTTTKEPLPELPPTSDLLKTSPIAKFHTHLESLFNTLFQICISHNSMLFILGHLDTKYQTYRMKSQPQMNSSQLSYADRGRVVLAPHVYEKLSTVSRISFWHDWYHHTPHFRENFPAVRQGHKVSINEGQLRLVFGVRVESHGGRGYGPVYFDVDGEFYHDDDDDKYEQRNEKYRLIDLSRVNNNYRREELSTIPSSPIMHESTVIDVSVTDESFQI